MDAISHSTKRKRVSEHKRPSKRSRPKSDSGSNGGEVEQILQLETEIFESESKKNYNNIAKLINILRDDTEEPEKSVVVAIALCRVFTRLMVQGDLVKTKQSTEKEVVVIRWLKERYSEYKAFLLGFLGEEGINIVALNLCMRLLKQEGQYLQNGQDYNFPVTFLTEIVQILLDPETDVAARKEFGGTYAEDNDDIRFYTFEALE
jgi:U3 small nucleolar RNA-associated protein 19